jgi:Sec-independent protein translocase protein TatA
LNRHSKLPPVAGAAGRLARSSSIDFKRNTSTMDEEYESLPKPKAKKTKKNIADSDLQYDDEDSKRPDSSVGGITNSD